MHHPIQCASEWFQNMKYDWRLRWAKFSYQYQTFILFCPAVHTSIIILIVFHTFRKCQIVPLCWNCHDNHATIECETIRKLRLPTTFLLDNFDVVTPLRVLLIFYRYAEQNRMNSCVDADLKSQIDELLNMESHCTERKETWIWQQHARNIIKPLRESNIDAIFQAVDAPWPLTDEFLQKICGVLDVNTFEVRTQHFEVCRVLFCHFPISDEFIECWILLFSTWWCLYCILNFSDSRNFLYVAYLHKRHF